MDSLENLPFFVYGTLILGQPNDYLWGDHVEQTLPAMLDQVELYAFPSFPMMIKADALNAQVVGQLIWVDSKAYQKTTRQIDMLENYNPADHDNSPYQRVVRTVTTMNGAEVKAWTYLGQPELIIGLPRIFSGDWVSHVEAGVGFASNYQWWRNRSTDKLF